MCTQSLHPSSKMASSYRAGDKGCCFCAEYLLLGNANSLCEDSAQPEAPNRDRITTTRCYEVVADSRSIGECVQSTWTSSECDRLRFDARFVRECPRRSTCPGEQQKASSRLQHVSSAAISGCPDVISGCLFGRDERAAERASHRDTGHRFQDLPPGRAASNSIDRTAVMAGLLQRGLSASLCLIRSRASTENGASDASSACSANFLDVSRI